MEELTSAELNQLALIANIDVHPEEEESFLKHINSFIKMTQDLENEHL